MAYAVAALDMAGKNKKEEAKKMLNKADKMMLEENFSYGMVSRNQQQNYISYIMLQASYAAGDTVLAAKITKSLRKDLEQQVNYYNSLNEDRQYNFDYIDHTGRKAGDKNSAEDFLRRIMALEQQYKIQSGLPPETSGPIINQPMAPDTQKR
jgi:hypothetical protein